ncbi:uncharacterized protein LOC111807722 isoform X1 [Cucurbita pepo subsp. pepo]|uniref:uncharacterized protein LOC111807722 isoform X1 n=1 Tax=Cucurbita pepo subsp. pepo TaxID=3664 RepID=UPI000C9DA2D5|nr:uncharacterized protein LOC111807722 isoform X1 [Cucurbita pepo subsp. pepo]
MDFKCSKAKLTVIVSRPSPTPSIIELQTMPQFFTHFFCNKPFHSSMSVNDYYDILFDMKQTDFDLIAMSHWEGNAYLKFIFFSPSRCDGCEALLPLLLAHEEFDVGVINYGIFVSIDLRKFTLFGMFLNDATHVTVTISNSEVKFSRGGEEFTLEQERKECIIGGVEEGDETQFEIITNETEFFNNLSRWSKAKRVWFFKSNDNGHGVIIIPIGLYARYLIYSSEGPNT